MRENVPGVHMPFCNAKCSTEGHWLTTDSTQEQHAHGPEMDAECGLCTDKDEA